MHRPNPPSDRERLFNESLQECNTAIAHLCRAFYPLDDYLCEDLYSVIISRLWNKIHLYRPTGSLSAWTLRVAVNAARTHYRLNAFQRRFLPLDTLHESALPRVDPEADDSQEAYRRLYRLIALLTPEERELLSLHFDRKTAEEIALILHTSPSSVSSRLNRIKNKLIALHKKGKDEPRSELFE